MLCCQKLIAYLRGISDTGKFVYSSHLLATCDVLNQPATVVFEGWLVSVLVQNLHDVRGFLIILFVILIGFTTTFRILFGDVDGQCELTVAGDSVIEEDCEDGPFGCYYRSFVSSFQMVILGEYEPSLLYESQYSFLAIIIFVLSVTGVFIVALNALISVLADSYARVQENAAANRRKERAEVSAFLASKNI